MSAVQPSPEPDTEPLLALRNITRTFPGVIALDDVSFDVRGGEVHALVGENGAGKSTLINVVSGVLRPDRGQLMLAGRPVQPASAVAARRLGIVTVHQEAELCGDLSVAENMALPQGLPTGRLGLVDWGHVFQSAGDAVASIGQPLDVRQAAGRLSVAQRHMTQVAAAVAGGAKILVLDEPTSALSDSEADWLFGQIARLKEAGAAIVYISHRQQEIFQLADRISVLRDGRRVWTGRRDEIDRAGLIEAMVGRPLAAAARPAAPPPAGDRQGDSPRLVVHGLSDAGGKFAGVDVTCRAGEIVGLYGLVGAGRSELARGLFGLRKTSAGSITIDGRAVLIRSPQDAVRAGLAYVPEDRLREALCRDLSVRANLVLASLQRWQRAGFSSARAERAATDRMTGRLGVRHRSPEQAIGQLSGGNQQKVVLARWLLTEPAVLLLDEPTRGVDVGAKDEIHRLVRELAGGGCAVLLISSELPELMQHADRVVVLREGRVAGEFDPARATPGQVAAAALPDHQRAAATPQPGARQPAASRLRSLAHRLPLGQLMLLVLVACLAAWLNWTSAGFSLISLFANASVWMLLGLAAAVVIIAGGIDISIGALLALSAACAAVVLRLPLPAAVTIPCALLVGSLVGAVGGVANAAISLAGRVHPIVVTLGSMTIYRGLVIAILGSKAVTGLPPQFGRLAIDPASGFRGSLLMAAIVVAAVYTWLNHCRSGRHLYAQGSGPAAARLAGISRTRTWLLAFGVGGALAGLAGVLELANSQQMQARLGLGWELNAIAVAVIGGVAITGGRGTVLGVLLGALLLRLINSALVRWSITDDQSEMFVGAMILGAVLLDLAWRRGGAKADAA